MNHAEAEAVVRAAYDAFNRNDVEAALGLLPVDFRWDFSARILDPAVLEGHDAFRRDLAALHDQWTSFRAEIEEVIPWDQGLVVLVVDRGRGRLSGIELEHRTASVWTFDGGRPAAMRFYRDRAQALADAGVA